MECLVEPKQSNISWTCIPHPFWQRNWYHYNSPWLTA